MRTAFLTRLRQRKLVQWALAYLAGAWLLLQVLHLLAETYAWPPPLMRSIPVLLAFGFLAALVVAWYHGEQGRQRVSGTELLMLGTLLVGAGAAVAVVGRTDDPNPVAGSVTAGLPAAGEIPADRESIAVLPFANLSAEPESEYFADGITEEILLTLARVPGLRVPGRTSSFYFKGKSLPTREIARQLGVAHVLEGSVRRAGNQVRIHVQLTDARAERSVWSESYDREVDDVFVLQGEIARAIVDRLQLRLAGDTPAAAGAYVPSAEAYDLYLQGRSLWAKRGLENLRRAILLFEQAVAQDPQFAAAHGGRALVLAVFPGYVDDPDPATLTAALAGAREALRLDPSLTDARLALAQANLALRRWAEAEAAFHQVLASDPANATAHLWYSGLLNAKGQVEEALTALQRATQLDPFSQVAWWNLANTLRVLGRPAEAVAAGRHATALDPASTWANQFLAFAFLGAGVQDSAIHYMQQAVRSSPRDALLLGYLAYVESAAGRHADARRRLSDILVERRRRVFSEVGIAVGYLGLEMPDSALVWLERSVEREDPAVWDNMIFVDPIFVEPLGADPRFHELARRSDILIYAPRSLSGRRP